MTKCLTKITKKERVALVSGFRVLQSTMIGKAKESHTVLGSRSQSSAMSCDCQPGTKVSGPESEVGTVSES